MSISSLGEQTLSVRDLAAKLRCSRPQVYRLVAQGLLPKGFSLGLRGRRWLASEIDSWLREQADTATKAS